MYVCIYFQNKGIRIRIRIRNVYASHPYSALPILFCCVQSLIPWKVFLLLSLTGYMFTNNYIRIYSHLNKYNQLVIAIFFYE